MISNPASEKIFIDFQGLSELKSQARQQTPESIGETARQFEALFMQMMLGSMRQASFGDDIFGSQQSEFYKDMLDQQLSLNLSRQGSSLGISDMLIQQLGAGRLGKFNGMEASQSIESDGARKDIQALLAHPHPSGKVPIEKPSTPENKTTTTEMLDPLDDDQHSFNKELISTADLPSVTLELYDAITEPVVSSNEIKTTAEVAKSPTLNSPHEFIQQLWPQASKAAQQLGVSPKFLIAQAALESGWGKSVIQEQDGVSTHNLFGIKADSAWQGDRVTRNSLEFDNGVMVKRPSQFRSYKSYGDSFNDYVDFLKTNPRYRQALTVTHDAQAFADELQKAGYATDPKYAQKLKTIMAGPIMNTAYAGIKNSNGRTIT